MQVEVALMEKKKEKNYRLSLVISILIAACLFVPEHSVAY